MAAKASVMAKCESVETLVGDELAQLIIEANTSFDADPYKAKCCIQRAAAVVRGKNARGPHDMDTPAVRGGLAAWQIKKLTAYIESNIGDRILAFELAALVRVSMGYFFRAFRTSFGASPHAYIMRQRILQAEVRMATSRDSLARIALDCGLSDQAHLSRAFRRIVGVSPNIWRRAAGVRPDVESPGTLTRMQACDSRAIRVNIPVA